MVTQDTPLDRLGGAGGKETQNSVLFLKLARSLQSLQNKKLKIQHGDCNGSKHL